MKILVTGSAGFIGMHSVEALLSHGHSVIGIDNINAYYDPLLKTARLNNCGINSSNLKSGGAVQSERDPHYTFYYSDITDKEKLQVIFNDHEVDVVCHLAAQAGVRYSLEDPYSYIDSNIQGFMNILECCRHYGVKHLVYASSSSVYGLNGKIPFSEEDTVDNPASLYGATKKANELMAHSYSHLYNMHTTGLRFFTVYGPWGRPDMALFLFTKAMLEGKPIQLFNNGNMQRDFTYITDIVEGVVRVTEGPCGGNSPKYRVYNIGRGAPVGLMEFVEEIEEALGRKAEKVYAPMQPGDVVATHADISRLIRDFGYQPSTSVREGVKRFVDWYVQHYGAAG